MSYTADLKTSLGENGLAQPAEGMGQELTDQPTTLELFSYALCCTAQGLLGVAYLVAITLVPLALHHGLF